MRAMHAHRQLMARKMSANGIHPAQMFCLREVAHDAGITQRDLAEKLCVARPTLTVMLQKMEKAGLIERRADETDQRYTRIYLAAGRRKLVHEQMHGVVGEVVAEMVGPLSEPDRAEARPPARSARRQHDPALDDAGEGRPMIRLLRTYLAPYKKQLALVMVLLLAQAMTNLYLPSLNADIINNGVATGDIPYILRVGAIMLGVTVLMGVTAVVGVYFGSKTSMAFGRDVRAAIFRKVETFSQTEVNRFGTPSLITRNTNDVQQVQMVVMMALNMMILAPVMAIGGIIMAVREDAVLSLILVVVLPLMAAFLYFVVSRADAAVQGGAGQDRPRSTRSRARPSRACA